MYINAKALMDGEVKGKAYSYQAEDSVKVDDIVLAPFGKTETMLKVVEINLDPKQFEGLDYEIKSIVGIVEDEPQTVVDLQITEEVLPVIAINYDEVKAALESEMTKYQKIIVTAETLSGCKATQKELAGLKRKIDTYRKDKKKVFSEPIVEFENKCKDLIALVETVETPIKKGIEVFDDEKKSEKSKVAQGIIVEVVAQYALTEKFAKQLTIIDKYMNLTATVKEVKADIEQRAMTLKVEQDRENELLEIIISTIESENTRINQKLSLSDFQRLIDLGSSTSDILADIKEKSERIYQAENAPKEEPKEEIPFAEPVEEVEELPVEVFGTELTPSNKIYILAKITG
jgi:hypothetical protein